MPAGYAFFQDSYTDLPSRAINATVPRRGGNVHAHGGYLLCDQVAVVGSYWMFHGENAFVITPLPMLSGIGILFRSGRSGMGWLLRSRGKISWTFGPKGA